MSARHFERTFAASPVAPGGCRIWAGGYDADGYARYSSEGAYRESYRVFIGAIPEGMTVDHTCFNIKCVEPAHLRLLTLLANARNRADRPRIASDDECVHGHPFNASNTYIKPCGRRDCRTCLKGRRRAYRARQRAGRAA